MPAIVMQHISMWVLYKSVREEMGLVEMIGLGKGMADARCGRMYSWKVLHDADKS